MNYDIILAIDPSGCYNEGNGTTGWCVFNALENKVIFVGDISAHSFPRQEAYWDKHLGLILNFHQRYGKKMVIILEDYLLYAHKAEQQINSRMETSQLLGVLKHYCWSEDIPYVMQPATEVKTRWEDRILFYKGYIKPNGRKYKLPDGTPVDKHCKDAIRHAVHFATFKNKKEA